MEEERKIGLFQTWNISAKRIEWSFTRVLQFMIALYWMYFDWYYLHLVSKANQDIAISFNFIFLNIVFLIAIFYPKYLKDLISLKEKLNEK